MEDFLSCLMNMMLRLLLIYYSHLIYSLSSSDVRYPSFENILDHLSSNGSLPLCTHSKCHQMNYSQVNLSYENLLKLSLSDEISPYLISSTGIYRGKRVKYLDRYVDQFLGIYYAESPELLKKPVRKRFSYSIANATKFTPCCIQSVLLAEGLSYGSFSMQRNSDNHCLSLNIYRADLRYGEKQKAIMIFSHGGSNQLGGGSLFDGSILASEGDIIVITMNFRLNYHGFLSTGDNRIKGNYGLWDQLLAIEWVYKNAHLFGGDRHRITLAGHSAGAGNAMLIPASPYCRGMIRRVISQSGNGLASWNINHQPMKLLNRLSKEYNCTNSNDIVMINCIYRLLQSENNDDMYRPRLTLNIADDNPYPVIDHDFLNDTLENVLQSDVYKNIDFLTGVTLNEGLYFAEFHIKNLYDNQLMRDVHSNRLEEKLYLRNQPSNHELESLKRFVKLNYIEQYINANFHHGKCFVEQVKKRYELPAKDNLIHRLRLYIDLVSDLMFNYHMVHCLNLRANIPVQNSTNYVYIYSHQPTMKVKSIYRDQLKLIPDANGHFAELDYVFGVPLARNYPRIHRNINRSYYNYSYDEENFSRDIMFYWSNFIKTGNPNKASVRIQWKAYTKTEHNYFYFQLNNLHNQKNYFDEMYDFWLNYFQLENTHGCNKKIFKKHLTSFGLLFLFLSIILLMCLLWKYFQKKKHDQLLSRSPTALLAHSHHIST